MTEKTLNFDSWLTTPLGQYLLSWEQTVLNKAVEDIFGYHALQFGLPSLHALAHNRMAHRWLILDRMGAEPSLTQAHTNEPPRQIIQPHLYTSFDRLPFPDQSIDLVILPHTLDLSADPHATLREVVRVLVPEGKVVMTGINPASLWGLLQRRVNFSQRFGDTMQFLPLEEGALIGYWRLRDWLRLLNLSVTSGSFGCYCPAFKTKKWLDKAKWMDAAGDRWWPILGATYQITATKRTQGVRLIGTKWKQPKAAKTVATAAHKAQRQNGNASNAND